MSTYSEFDKKRRLEEEGNDSTTTSSSTSSGVLRLNKVYCRRCKCSAVEKSTCAAFYTSTQIQVHMAEKLAAQPHQTSSVHPPDHDLTQQKADSTRSEEISHQAALPLEEKAPAISTDKFQTRLCSESKDTALETRESLCSGGVGLRPLDLSSSISIATSPIASTFYFESTHLIEGEKQQYMNNLKCLELCPTNNMLFATSGLDGLVSLWEIENKGASTKHLGSIDCSSPNLQRCPENLAWHPDGNRIFAVYNADNGNSQVSTFSLSQIDSQKKAFFLEKFAHKKGEINQINFLPRRGQIMSSFLTCGSDRAVVLWKEGMKCAGWWGQEVLHKDEHRGAVTAAFGLPHMQVVLSVGLDKRVVLFNLERRRTVFKLLLGSRCFNALPNPGNCNLFLVHVGSPGKQLQLFDLREKPKALHVVGWDEKISERQSAITPAWSPNGRHISSGSNDSMIHIFDIRHTSQGPSQSVDARSKGVLKAAWHRSLPLLISISDHNIGLHKYL